MGDVQLTAYEDSLAGYLEIQKYLNIQRSAGYRFVSWLVTPSGKVLVMVSRDRARVSDSNFFEEVAP